jgi:restriction endonuclease Mrr
LQEAHGGFIITTSSFTEAAIESAALTQKIVLIAMDDLVHWHAEPPVFDFGASANDIPA